MMDDGALIQTGYALVYLEARLVQCRQWTFTCITELRLTPRKHGSERA
jgi:hypothetical protein